MEVKGDSMKTEIHTEPFVKSLGKITNTTAKIRLDNLKTILDCLVVGLLDFWVLVFFNILIIGFSSFVGKKGLSF